jgi:two-component system, OmpR family, sensor kinase
MKLTSRLVIVLTLFISLATFSAGTFSIISNHDQQINNYKKSLNSIHTQLKFTKEDPVSLALLIANQSTFPMSLAFITDDNQYSYLVDNAGENLGKVTKDLVDKGDKANLIIDSNLVRFFKTGKGEALAFQISTREIDSQINQIWQRILIFNLLLILICVLAVLLIFRRDSKLNSSAKAMQEFIGDASHELKTPLTVIRGYSEMLSTNSENVEKYASRINSESIRMANIIERLLKIAALDEGQKDDATDIDVTKYLKSRIEDILILQPKREITFISNSLNIKVPYDLFDILLSNILTNARVHSPEDSPIQISIEGKRVIIEDGGPGLQEIPDKPFKRFDKSRSRETGGSGLGMSLIQKSAKELGAKLKFGKSDLGGLKVEITF